MVSTSGCAAIRGPIRFLFNAYLGFVERAARLTPIIAVFEDLHWADEPTLQLLLHVAQIVATVPMLLIGTYRNSDLDAECPFADALETLMRQKLATRIALRRLPVGGVEAMLSAMSGQVAPPPLARAIFAETEGNPFFVAEVFRHLAEEGRLFDESGRWIADLRVVEVPEGVRLVMGPFGPGVTPRRCGRGRCHGGLLPASDRVRAPNPSSGCGAAFLFRARAARGDASALDVLRDPRISMPVPGQPNRIGAYYAAVLLRALKGSNVIRAT